MERKKQQQPDQEPKHSKVFLEVMKYLESLPEEEREEAMKEIRKKAREERERREAQLN